MSTATLDITKDHCPMTFVKAKLRLEQLAEGDILEILLTEGEPLENVPRTCTEQGFQVLETTHVRDNIHKVVVKK
jgi:TusA-related sulfurtransferase